MLSARYRNYLDSARWTAFRNQVIRRYGNRCAICGADGRNEIVQVHHLNYDRLEHERLSDCVLLCVPCHRAADLKRQRTTWYKGKRVHRRRFKA